MSQSPIYLDINNNKSVITALKAGEEKVFDVVYRHYFRRLCAFCSQYVGEQVASVEQLVLPFSVLLPAAHIAFRLVVLESGGSKVDTWK
jgi:hypothetical protein